MTEYEKYLQMKAAKQQPPTSSAPTLYEKYLQMKAGRPATAPDYRADYPQTPAPEPAQEVSRQRIKLVMPDKPPTLNPFGTLADALIGGGQFVGSKLQAANEFVDKTLGVPPSPFLQYSQPEGFEGPMPLSPENQKYLDITGGGDPIRERINLGLRGAAGFATGVGEFTMNLPGMIAAAARGSGEYVEPGTESPRIQIAKDLVKGPAQWLKNAIPQLDYLLTGADAQNAASPDYREAVDALMENPGELAFAGGILGGGLKAGGKLKGLGQRVRAGAAEVGQLGRDLTAPRSKKVGPVKPETPVVMEPLPEQFKPAPEVETKAPARPVEPLEAKPAIEAPAEPSPTGITAYHGSASAFRSFDDSFIGTRTDGGYYGRGHYFSESPETAEAYATKRGGSPNISKVRLDIKKPFIIDWTSYEAGTRTRDAARSAGVELSGSGFLKYPEEATNKLQGQGYDGVIARRHVDDPAEYVVFSDKQISSYFKEILSSNELPPPKAKPAGEAPAEMKSALEKPKEPWEMTREEWYDKAYSEGRRGNKQVPLRRIVGDEHEGALFEAVRTGKPVPPEVLAEYPDLAAKYKAPAAPATEPVKLKESEPLAPELKETPETFNEPKRPTSDIQSSYAPRSQATASLENISKGKPVRIEEIRNKLSKDFGLPIRTGRFRSNFGTMERGGIYKGQSGVARLKEWNDVTTLTHEVAHHLDKKFNLKNTLFRGDKELPSLDYSPNQKSPTEGFAEFVRGWMTGEDFAQTKAPKFAAKFEAWLDANPATKKTMVDSKKMIMQFWQQGAFERVRSQIGRSATVSLESTTKQAIGDAYARFKDLWIDPGATIKRFESEARGLKDINAKTVKPTESPYLLAWDVRQAATAKAHVWVKEGVRDFAGNLVSKSLKEVLAPVADKFEDWQVYAYSRRGADLWKRDINPGISKADADFNIRNLETPGFKKALDDIQVWQGNALDYLVDAGGLTKEARTAIEVMNPVYVPLQRVFSGVERVAGTGKRLGNISSPIKRIKGSGRPIEPILESMIRQTAAIISTADRVRVGRAIVELSKNKEGLGRWIEKIDPPKQVVKTTIEGIKKQLEDAGVDLTDTDLSQVLDIYTNAKRITGKDNVVSFVNADGKAEFFELHPNLYKSIQNTDAPQMNIILRALSYPARLKRLAVTGLNPEFAAGVNPFRDAFTFALQSEYFSRSVTRLPKEIVKKLRGEFGGDEYGKLYRASGADMSTMMGLDRRSLQRTVGDVLANDAKAKSMNIVKHPIDVMRQILSVTESGPRKAEFKSAYKELEKQYGKGADTRIGAAIAARDVTVDFTRMGAYARVLNSVIPFFNIQLQDPAKIIRSFRAHPIASTMKGTALLTAPTILLWTQNKDEQWYKEMPAWRKYSCWNFRIGDYEDGTPKILSLPRPFTWGLAFASAPEAYLNYRESKDPQEIKSLVDNIVSQMSPGYIPTALQVPIEQQANKNIFLGREIVPAYMQDKSAEDQYFRSTPKTYRELGRAFGWSPLRIQHAVEGATGSIITRGLRQGERAIGVTEPDQRMKQLSDIPVGGRFFPYQKSKEERAKGLEYDRRRKLSELRERFRAGKIEEAMSNLYFWNKKYPDFNIIFDKVVSPPEDMTEEQYRQYLSRRKSAEQEHERLMLKHQKGD